MAIPLRFLLAGLALSTSQAYALSPASVFLHNAASVLVLETLDDAGRTTGMLSATAITPNTLVTVCNGIDSAFELRVVRAKGAIPAKLQARDHERNLCLLSAPGLDTQALSPAPSGPAIGNRVYAVSNALGLGIGMSDGIVSGMRKFPSGEYLQFTAPVSPGSEGGALIDEQGQLLGIIDYRRRDGQNVNFAMPAAWISQIAPRAAADAPRLLRYEQALALSRKKNWDELLQLTETWSKEAPDADAWSFFILAAREKKMADAEMRGWLIAKQPALVPAHGILTMAYLVEGNVPGATQSYRRLWALAPGVARQVRQQALAAGVMQAREWAE